ncbi:hypothetical protein Nepgr_013449 [Nepenthes gracilis]|uniref:Uncharacterized protein n=1 Tax=Nepenthes gracilis TaxID=150966 RepID=A0AAD3XP02_NEPGR|nr:hypothetical protein Nepgr_013449 [Nepenthes gracilis]
MYPLLRRGLFKMPNFLFVGLKTGPLLMEAVWCCSTCKVLLYTFAKNGLLPVAEALVGVLKLVWLLSRLWCFHCSRHDGWLLCVVSPILPAARCCVREQSLMNISVLLVGLHFCPMPAGWPLLLLEPSAEFLGPCSC